MHHCFFVFRRIGENISLDLFHLINLTSSYSLIPRLPKTNRTQPKLQSLPKTNRTEAGAATEPSSAVITDEWPWQIPLLDDDNSDDGDEERVKVKDAQCASRHFIAHDSTDPVSLWNKRLSVKMVSWSSGFRVANVSVKLLTACPCPMPRSRRTHNSGSLMAMGNSRQNALSAWTLSRMKD